MYVHAFKNGKNNVYCKCGWNWFFGERGKISSMSAQKDVKMSTIIFHKLSNIRRIVFFYQCVYSYRHLSTRNLNSPKNSTRNRGSSSAATLRWSTVGYLGGPISDGKEVFGVGRVALDRVDRSVVCLERHCNSLGWSLRFSAADVCVAHLRSDHELGRLRTQHVIHTESRFKRNRT